MPRLSSLAYRPLPIVKLDVPVIGKVDRYPYSGQPLGRCYVQFENGPLLLATLERVNGRNAVDITLL